MAGNIGLSGIAMAILVVYSPMGSRPWSHMCEHLGQGRWAKFGWNLSCYVCSVLSPLWAPRWIHKSGQCHARQTWIPSHRLSLSWCAVPIYTAWWHRHMCVNNLPKVVTWLHQVKEMITMPALLMAYGTHCISLLDVLPEAILANQRCQTSTMHTIKL